MPEGNHASPSRRPKKGSWTEERFLTRVRNQIRNWFPTPLFAFQDFSPTKPRTVIFTSGDDIEAKKVVIELINSTGFVAIDLGSLAKGGAMHEVGAPLSGLDLHFVRRLR